MTFLGGSEWMGRQQIDRLFSVIVPTYNRADTVLLTLCSVKKQEYRPIEVVVIDDGSTDNTQEVVSTWIEENSTESFRCVYEFQDNSGASSARNHGLKVCAGEYIQFLDSDDTLHPNRLGLLAKAFIEEGSDYIETGFEGFLSSTGEVVETHEGHVGVDQVEWLLRGRLWPNTLRSAYRRSLLASTGAWNEELRAFEDYEYAIRALTVQPLPRTHAIRNVLASARRDTKDRRSNFFRTREGRATRIHCERVLCNAVRNRQDISSEHVSQLASRLYALGFRSTAQGWPDLGDECVKLAESLGCELDSLGRRRRMVARSGYLGAKLYNALGILRRRLKVD